MNVIQRIDSWAQRDPQRVAYNYLGKENTYLELKNYSDSVAAAITNMDLPDKAPIIVYGGQEFEMIAVFLGIVKTGHAYIPIDSDSPSERLVTINRIAQPVACIAVEELPVELAGLPVVTPAKLKQLFSERVSFSAANQVKGSDVFYIIFTSGTTGVPKGVQISAQNLESFLAWMESDFGIKDESTFLSQPPYSFDLSVMDLYPALTRGGTLSVIPKKVTEDFRQLFSVLPQLKLNVWVSTPSFMDICLLEKSFDEEHYPQLQHFLFCGEELTHKTAQQLLQRFPHAAIYNTYGPTETTVAVTQVQITADLLAKYERLPIGKTKADTKVVVVDENLQEVAAGTAGEILIYGPSVSQGYLNNPAKTKQAFVKFNEQNAYRTGDLGEFDEAGQLLYKGRLDFQVKLHGFRIELEEVDYHLGKVGLVEQAACVPKYGMDHKVSQLVAFVVAKHNEFKNNLELTKAIKEQLATLSMPYMIPQRFVYVDSLPLTTNGKVDRKHLFSEVNH